MFYSLIVACAPGTKLNYLFIPLYAIYKSLTLSGLEILSSLPTIKKHGISNFFTSFIGYIVLRFIPTFFFTVFKTKNKAVFIKHFGIFILAAIRS